MALCRAQHAIRPGTPPCWNRVVLGAREPRAARLDQRGIDQAWQTGARPRPATLISAGRNRGGDARLQQPCRHRSPIRPSAPQCRKPTRRPMREVNLGAVLERDTAAGAARADTADRSAANPALLERRAISTEEAARRAGCRRISSAATRPTCPRRSSTSSAPGNAGGPLSCTPSAWHAPGSRSASAISPTILPGSPGSRRGPRRRDAQPDQRQAQQHIPKPSRDCPPLLAALGFPRPNFAARPRSKAG